MFIVVFSLLLLNLFAQEDYSMSEESKANMAVLKGEETLYYPTTTTEQEYIYSTNGIPNSISNALDVKNGYLLDGKKDFSSFNNYDYTFKSYYSFKFVQLTRESDKSLAATIIKAHSSYSGSTYWYCLPYNNKDLLERFFNSVNSLDESMTTALLFAYISESSKDRVLKNTFDKVLNTTSAKQLLKLFGFTEYDATEYLKYK